MRKFSLDQMDLLHKKLSQTESVLDLLLIATDTGSASTPSMETINSATWLVNELVLDTHDVIAGIDAKGSKLCQK